MNVRGLADKNKRKDVFHWLKGKKASVYFLQETHCTDNVENIWSNEWGSECFFSNFTSKSAGVAILLNDNFEFKVIECKKIENGRILSLDIKIEENILTLINIYAYNQGNPNFFPNNI